MYAIIQAGGRQMKVTPGGFATIDGTAGEPGVEARTEATPALADDDRAAGDEVAVVRLDAEALRVRVAPVAGAALTFFVCHSAITRWLVPGD